MFWDLLLLTCVLMADYKNYKPPRPYPSFSGKDVTFLPTRSAPTGFKVVYQNAVYEISLLGLEFGIDPYPSDSLEVPKKLSKKFYEGWEGVIPRLESDKVWERRDFYATSARGDLSLMLLREGIVSVRTNYPFENETQSLEAEQGQGISAKVLGL